MAGPILALALSAAGETYDEMKEFSPLCVREAAEMHRENLEMCAYGSTFAVFVAGLNAEGRGDAFMICNDQRLTEPFAVHPVGGLAMLPADPEILQDCANRLPPNINPQDLDPESHGLIILEAQRRFALANLDHRHHELKLSPVGGFAQLTSVTREGISTRVLHRWPDVRGQLIGSAAA
jgi:hypothetical protein